MKHNIFDENLLRSFLLGKLSEEEQTNLEQAAFADADLFANLQSIENDLIDEYVRGELSKAEREGFERLFLNSSARRQKIEFAKTWRQLETQTAVSERAENYFSSWSNFWKSLFPFSLSPQLAFAALAVLILTGGILFFISQTQSEKQIATGQNNNSTVPLVLPRANVSPVAPMISPTAMPPPKSSPLIQQPDKNINQPTNQPNQNRQPNNSSPATATFATLVFPVGVTRDGNSQALRLKLPPNVARANLVFNLEKGDEYQTYKIEVRTKSSNSNILKMTGARVGQKVIYSVPATKLAAGNYEAVLRGLNAYDQSETIGYYNFEVVKP